MEVQVVETQRGQASILHSGYKYALKCRNKNSTKRWICMKRPCPGSITTSERSNVLSERPHSCVPSVAKNEVEISLFRAKKRAREEMTPVPQIFRQELMNLQDTGLVTEIPTFMSVKDTLYRQRHKKLGIQRLPRCRTEIQIPEWAKGYVLADNETETHSMEGEDSISDADVPDMLPVDQPTPVDETTIKIEIEEVEIEEEPLRIENESETSDIHGEPMLPFIKDEPSDEPYRITPETAEQLDESDRQSIQMFFDSMARTVMTLSPSFVSRIKLEVLRVVTDMEMEAYKKKMVQSKIPNRNPENITAASEEAEPRIKIKVESEEEASEALTEPDEPESLDPDYDVNYEPLTKKKKKSKAANSTSSSSALTDERTPRTLHEPVETFFQSIAYTVTSFPPPFVCKAKVAVLKVVSKMEVEACRSRQSGCQDGGGGEANDNTERHLLASGSDY